MLCKILLVENKITFQLVVFKLLGSISCLFTKKDSDNVPRLISYKKYSDFDHDLSYKTTNEDKYFKYSVSENSIVSGVTVKHVSGCFHLTPSHNKEKLAFKNEYGIQILNVEEPMTDSNYIVPNNNMHVEETSSNPLPISLIGTPKTTFDTNSKSDQSISNEKQTFVVPAQIHRNLEEEFSEIAPPIICYEEKWEDTKNEEKSKESKKENSKPINEDYVLSSLNNVNDNLDLKGKDLVKENSSKIISSSSREEIKLIVSSKQSVDNENTDLVTTESLLIPLKGSTNDFQSKEGPRNNFNVVKNQSSSFDFKTLLLWVIVAVCGAVLADIVILLTTFNK